VSETAKRISKIFQDRYASDANERIIQCAAEITPTFQRGITNKWYEVSAKTFYFPNVEIKKFFYFRFSKLYRPNGGRDGRYAFGAILLEWPPLVGTRTEDDV
jgi:hypothetical protein